MESTLDRKWHRRCRLSPPELSHPRDRIVALGPQYVHWRQSWSIHQSKVFLHHTRVDWHKGIYLHTFGLLRKSIRCVVLVFVVHGEIPIHCQWVPRLGVLSQHAMLLESIALHMIRNRPWCPRWIARSQSQTDSVVGRMLPRTKLAREIFLSLSPCRL